MAISQNKATQMYLYDGFMNSVNGQCRSRNISKVPNSTNVFFRNLNCSKILYFFLLFDRQIASASSHSWTHSSGRRNACSLVGCQSLRYPGSVPSEQSGGLVGLLYRIRCRHGLVGPPKIKRYLHLRNLH